MLEQRVNHLLGRVRELLTSANFGALPDRELLEKFVADRDEAAFTALVRRHGSMVMGVCWRILRNPHDVEDAWQATFLILVRKAGAIRKRASVSSWLHGVALRVSQKLKRQQSRRPPTLAFVENGFSDPVLEAMSWQDVSRLLDEELNRLPERFRQPVALCYLEGKTRDEAAAELGWSFTTLRGRLEQGRKLLKRRLSARGVAFSAALVSAALAPGAALAVPRQWIANLVQTVTSSAWVSNRVQNLVEGAIRTMFLRKLSIPALVAGLVFGMLLSGWVYFSPETFHSVQAAQAPEPKSKEPAPKAKDKDKPATPKAREADKELEASVKTSTEKAIAWLKKAQNKDGSWTEKQFNHPEGVSALAMLALLEGGVEASDDAIVKGLKYLRSFEPNGTYNVSLHTMVLAIVNDKQDADRIRRNVDWLEKAAVRPNNQLRGWSYAPSAERSDGSCTQYAVLGLSKASQAGVKPKNENLWKEIRQMYVSSQGLDGGWSYSSGGGSTQTMTQGGLCGLFICDLELSDSPKESKNAIENGMGWIGKSFNFKQSFAMYSLYGTGRLGKLSGQKTFNMNSAKMNWYREGVDFLLKKQADDGAISENVGGNAMVIGTSFGLLFLASGH
jgi:RNA polymerase sigma factor (sigma-70 family)